jgi:flagellar motor protein MotB
MQWKERRIWVAAVTTLLSANLFAQTGLFDPPKPAQAAPAAHPAKLKQVAAQQKPPARARAKTVSQAQKQVDDLRELVAAQQQQLEAQRAQVEHVSQQLQQLLDAQQQGSAAAQKIQGSAEQAQATAAQAQQSADEAQRAAAQASSKATEATTALVAVKTQTQQDEKKLGTLETLAGRFRFNGDLRVRGESIFQDGVADRNRGRIRVRFGVEGKLNDDFIGGFALATGTLGDPTTTNETFTNFFDRKTIALDKGYVIYQPQAHKWLQATAGKFAYTWNRTAVTGDPDINPEGFSQKLSWDFKSPVVKNFSVQAMQLLFNEVTGGTDSYAIGGQVAGKLQFGRLTSIPSFMALKWNSPDPILNATAFAVGATTTTGGLPVPGEGPGCAKGNGLSTVPPCAFSANGMTNATYTDASGKAHFYSQFLYADLILNNQIKTGFDRWPVNLILEYEDNIDAEAHPLNSKGVVIPDLGKQGHVYMGDLSVGQNKNKNDVQIGYLWLRQEQDAVIASFSESDQRAPTNILQHKLYATWKVRPNTTFGYTYWIGRTLNSALQHATLPTGVTPGEVEPWVRRMQFDLMYTF